MSTCRYAKPRLPLPNGSCCKPGTEALLQLLGCRCSGEYLLLGRLPPIEVPDCLSISKFWKKKHSNETRLEIFLFLFCTFAAESPSWQPSV